MRKLSTPPPPVLRTCQRAEKAIQISRHPSPTPSLPPSLCNFLPQPPLPPLIGKLPPPHPPLLSEQARQVMDAGIGEDGVRAG